MALKDLGPRAPEAHSIIPQDWASKVYSQLQQKDSNVISLTELATSYFTDGVVASERPLSTQVLALTTSVRNPTGPLDCHQTVPISLLLQFLKG